MMEEGLITVANYLTVEERNRLMSFFNARKIPFVVNGHGPTDKFGSYYYLIKVEKRNFDIANNLVKSEKSRIFMASKKCPNCKSLDFTRLVKKGLWERVLYFGTTVVRCNFCKSKYSI
jgi:hypothetical protein